jgi:hypothetical protein
VVPNQGGIDHLCQRGVSGRDFGKSSVSHLYYDLRARAIQLQKDVVAILVKLIGENAKRLRRIPA